jgi:hypothetical protein
LKTADWRDTTVKWSPENHKLEVQAVILVQANCILFIIPVRDTKVTP